MALVNARMQMKRGNEANFDPDKMLPGEWAVSLDTKYVRMCFSAGVCVRMATYEAFEEDMEKIESILKECQDIEEAVTLINTQVSTNAQAVAEYTEKAKLSEENAKKSEQTAISNATTATTKASEALTSATNASKSEKLAQSYAVGGTDTRLDEDTDNAKYYKEQADTLSKNAKLSAETATEKANISTVKASEATASANTVKSMSDTSKSYAVGGTGTREGENTDNSKYYYEQSKLISEGLGGALIPVGTILFENLPELEDVENGWMYNISNQFATTNEFKEGAGNIIPAGSNIYKTADGYWDVLAGSPVVGVKGNEELSYRTGNVNITPENIGAVSTEHVQEISKGGTGGTTDREARYNLLKDMDEWDTDSVDDSLFVMRSATPSTTGTTIGYTKGVRVWNYIKSKISSIFGITSVANGVPSINGITTRSVEKPNNSGRESYLKLFDVTYWYTADSSTVNLGKRGFAGIIYSQRNGGNLSDHLYKVIASVSYKKATAENLINLCLRSENETYQPCIIRDVTNEKYYLAIRVSGSGRSLKLQGTFVGAYVGGWVNGNANSTMPDGWELVQNDYKIIPAAQATKLATARTIQTKLDSTSSASFDGSGNVTPGITGTLGVANGGTGATSSIAAQYNLLNKNLLEEVPTITDSMYSAGVFMSPSATRGAIFKTPFTSIWTYIKSKLDIIGTMEEVEANTESGKIVDSLVFKDFSNNLAGFTPVVDETTGQITGYKTKVGADTVFPFKGSGASIHSLGVQSSEDGSTETYDISQILPDVDFTKLTDENFIVGISGSESVTTSYLSGASSSYQYKASTSSINLTKSYDSTTGILSINVKGGVTTLSSKYSSGSWSDRYKKNVIVNIFAYLIV